MKSLIMLISESLDFKDSWQKTTEMRHILRQHSKLISHRYMASGSSGPGTLTEIPYRTKYRSATAIKLLANLVSFRLTKLLDPLSYSDRRRLHICLNGVDDLALKWDEIMTRQKKPVIIGMKRNVQCCGPEPDPVRLETFCFRSPHPE